MQRLGQIKDTELTDRFLNQLADILDFCDGFLDILVARTDISLHRVL
jgi:hypothetical protein